MDTMTDRTWAEIDLSALEHNYRTIRAALPDGCRFLALMKANAYGHGAVAAAHCMERAGADYLGVACFEEARELRAAGVCMPILILGASDVREAVPLVELGVTQAISSLEMARAFSQRLTAAGCTLRAHLKLDTGMGRTGFHTADGAAMAQAAQALALPGLDFEGVFTHFAVSDEPDAGCRAYTHGQFSAFCSAVEQLEAARGARFAIRHCANSGAVLSYRDEMCLDMVRPGLLLYGMYPGGEHGGLTLRPVMQLKTRVAAICEHAPGETVSYGRTFTCDRPMRLAVLPIGYADGLHRTLSNRMHVLLHGQRVRQVGRICMDMCMADVTDLPECAVGDVATLFGTDGDAVLPVEELAELAGTINYEMVCAPSRRIPRVYRR